MRFELPGAGSALFTTRADGNLSTVTGAGLEHGGAVRERLREALGLRSLCAGRQVHGRLVRRVRARDRGTGQLAAQEADGQATDLSRVGMMVLTADCLPVVLGSERAVAALHAGWRGLAAGVLEEGVRAVRELGGSPRADEREDAERAEGLVAVIGPGAGPCCYGVGLEVHAALDYPGESGHAGAGGDRAPGASSPIDLKAIARQRLLAAGVESVEVVDLCTICDPRFFSHRRESARAGRQAGIAWLG
jgi:polyphenol oxidase